MKDNEYLTKKEVCEIFRISESSLNRLIAKGLPIIKIGKAVRFKLSIVERWLIEEREMKKDGNAN